MDLYSVKTRSCRSISRESFRVSGLWHRHTWYI